MVGRRVGPWRLGRLLGRGGMGAVYEAARADGAYDRRVALKLLRPGPDAAALAARLKAERQILARLEYPGIARLYDGGVTPGGLPFFVMEYVEGAPITEHAEALDLKGRVQLMARVCDAVAYAHQNLVVHRDLKPSNVLVTPEGADGNPSVRLLDCGIAKVLAEGGDIDGGLTRTGHGPMTPQYAALQREAVEAFRVSVGNDHPDLGFALNNLGSTLGSLDRHDEAKAALHEGLAIYHNALGENHPNLGFLHINLGKTLQEEGQVNEAEQHVRHALRLW